MGSQTFRLTLSPSTTQYCSAPLAAQVFPPGYQVIGSLRALTLVHLSLCPLVRFFKSQLCPKTILALQWERCCQAARGRHLVWLLYIAWRITHLPPTQDFESHCRGWSWLKGTSHAAPGLIPDVLIAELRRGWCFPSRMSVHQEGKKVTVDSVCGGVGWREKEEQLGSHHHWGGPAKAKCLLQPEISKSGGEVKDIRPPWAGWSKQLRFRNVNQSGWLCYREDQ